MGDFFLLCCTIMHKLSLRVAASVARSGQRYSRTASLGSASRVAQTSTRCYANMKSGSDTNVNAAVNPDPEMNPKDQLNMDPKKVQSNPVAEEAVGVAEEATPVENTKPEETEGAVKDKMEKTEKVVGPSSSHQFQAETRIDPYIEPEIHITADNESNTIVIQDFGIGMTADELKENLGTIARSGTLEFVKNKENSQSFIGQFGVGF